MASNQKVEENRPPLKFNFICREVGLLIVEMDYEPVKYLIPYSCQASTANKYHSLVWYLCCIQVYTGCIQHLLVGKIEF